MRQLLLLLGMISIALHSYAQPTTSATFSLNTTSFFDQSTLPPFYTCDGKNISPELEWKATPSKTKSLALILADPDAPGGVFFHWVLYNIPPTTTTLAEGISKLPAGAKTGMNSWNALSYKGPCPPKGSTHSYIFTLYALDTTLNLAADANASDVMHAMQNHILAKANLTAFYGH